MLVASTDGVGTKIKIAAALGRFDTIGHDIVNHCINDILVQGARPLFFLDYIAAGRLDPGHGRRSRGGLRRGLPGGGLRAAGRRDGRDAGRLRAGRVRPGRHHRRRGGPRRRSSTGEHLQPGDAIIGLASSGLHTNGYSLARRVLAGLDLRAEVARAGRVAGRGAARAAPLLPCAASARLQAAGVDLKGLAHITGGGLIDNPPRIFPPGWRTAAAAAAGRCRPFSA